MQINKIGLIGLAVLFLLGTAVAHEKKWPEKRLKQAWTEAQSFTSKQVSLGSGQISELKNNGIQIGAEDRSPTFYFAQDKNAQSGEKAKTLGIILFIDEAGANGVMEISIAMGTDGRIKKIDIWEHSENSLIAKEDFLKQFVGKSSKDSFDDYRAVPGAEKASEAVAKSAKKALKISNIVYEKK